MSATEKANQIQTLLAERGIRAKVLTFSESTKTSLDAARQAGCSLGQIAKSIVFRTGNEPLLVIASGPNRVSLAKLEQLVGAKPEKADADFVYEKTGFPIGGVPAFGHKNPIAHIFMDEDLLQYQTIWSAAGTPHAIYEIEPQTLAQLSQAKIANVKE